MGPFVEELDRFLVGPLRLDGDLSKLLPLELLPEAEDPGRVERMGRRKGISQEPVASDDACAAHPARPQILAASADTADLRESAPAFTSSACLTMPIPFKSSSEISLSGPDVSSFVTFE